jgi:signal transduction histidine kinase
LRALDELRVTDDGRGFDTGGADRAGHFGLGIMRERAHAIGATVAVDSASGEGTSVRVVWEDRRPEEEPA